MDRRTKILGAAIGDIVGSRFEFDNHKSTDFELFHSSCDFTDDTVCSVAVTDWVLQGCPNHWAKLLQNWCLRYPNPMGAYSGIAGWRYGYIGSDYGRDCRSVLRHSSCVARASIGNFATRYSRDFSGG
ncbi:Uncharacterised protein [Kingella negevensis]|uniref:ADP-ribosylglycohydrolase n=1 Tax=Kingella negevensis TaxID=1522312 RepID=A0A238HJ54_9NEIS|nr:Uncharacterised protein [Kingella negevensis]